MMQKSGRPILSRLQIEKSEITKNKREIKLVAGKYICPKLMIIFITTLVSFS